MPPTPAVPSGPPADGIYIAQLVVIMLLAGLLGGGVNFVINRDEDKAFKSLIDAVLAGVAASFLVPLFLHMLKNTLVADAVKNPLLLLVFAGFCLVAAISSRAVIRAVSDKALKLAEEANKKAGEATKQAGAATQKAVVAGTQASTAQQMAIGAAEALENQVAVGLARQADSEPGPRMAGRIEEPAEALEAAIAEYDRLRSQAKGAERFRSMGRVFFRMRDLVPSLGDSEEPLRWLSDKDAPGRRLAAYAYLTERAAEGGSEFALSSLPPLLGALSTTEDQNFGRYWGIVAIRHLIDRVEGEVPAEISEGIRMLASSGDNPPGSDRWFELQRIMNQRGIDPGAAG